MSMRAPALFRALTVLALTAAFAAGCSSSGDGGGGSAAGESTTTTTAAPTPGGPAPTQPRPTCAAATLQPAAAASFANAQLVDVVCETDFATATLVNGPGGENVILFGLQDGAWVVVGNGPVDADAAAFSPAGFSPTAVPAWQRLRTSRLTRAAAGDKGSDTASSGPTSTRVNPVTGLLEVCTQTGADSVTCSAPTTTIPVDPNAPTTTIKSSNFCKYNYNDPRCTSSNQQYQP